MSLWRRVLRVETAVGVNDGRLRARQRLLTYLRTRQLWPDARLDFTPEEEARFDRIRATSGELSPEDSVWLDSMSGEVDPKLHALLEQLADEDLKAIADGRGFA